MSVWREGTLLRKVDAWGRPSPALVRATTRGTISRGADLTNFPSPGPPCEKYDVFLCVDKKCSECSRAILKQTILRCVQIFPCDMKVACGT